MFSLAMHKLYVWNLFLQTITFLKIINFIIARDMQGNFHKWIFKIFGSAYAFFFVMFPLLLQHAYIYVMYDLI